MKSGCLNCGHIPNDPLEFSMNCVLCFELSNWTSDQEYEKDDEI